MFLCIICAGACFDCIHLAPRGHSQSSAVPAPLIVEQVSELKEKLAAAGLSQDGLKDALVDRLVAHIAASPAAASPAGTAPAVPTAPAPAAASAATATVAPALVAAKAQASVPAPSSAAAASSPAATSPVVTAASSAVAVPALGSSFSAELQKKAERGKGRR